MDEEKFVKFQGEIKEIDNLEVLSYWMIIDEEITKRMGNKNGFK